MREISLTRGFVTLVDDDDFDWLSQWSWCVLISAEGRRQYAKRGERVDGAHTSIRMHRQIIAAPKGFDVDHEDGNGLNNQRYNLRVATRGQNNVNSGKPRGAITSQFKGVWFNRQSGKWHAYCGKSPGRYIGVFPTEIGAAVAYNEEAIKRYGAFARLNQV